MEHPDAMNLDDFIFSENFSTPAGMSPPRELRDREENACNAVASAIPIKLRKEKEPSASFVPQSVPIGQHGPRANKEFGYVQRHIRKTSIDERRVSRFISRAFVTMHLPLVCMLADDPSRLVRGRQISLPKCPLLRTL